MNGPAPSEQSSIEFTLLGPLQIMVDGATRPLAGVKPKALLAMLLINRNRVVQATSLADGLWNDDPPPAYPASLQVFMSKLRRSLRSVLDTEVITITTESAGYRLAIDPLKIDLGRFEQARAAGDREYAAGRFDEASRRFQVALDEWVGPALVDLRGFRFAEEFAAAVEEERLTTLQSRIDADLACGRDSALIVELATLSVQHPSREPFWAQLITAYYRSGRQVDALAACRRIRSYLNEELGIDPGFTIRDLEQTILRQESLAGPRSSSSPDQSRTQVEARPWLSSGRVTLETGRTVPIPAQGLRIGRMPDNDLTLDGPKVSRYHAIIVHTGVGFAVSDLRSTNGVLVGSTRVLDSQMLRTGEIISIGGHEITFESD